MIVVAGGNDGKLIWTIKYSDKKECSKLVKDERTRSTQDLESCDFNYDECQYIFFHNNLGSDEFFKY